MITPVSIICAVITTISAIVCGLFYVLNKKLKK